MNRFFPQYPMSNYENMLRIFSEIRLHPWIPEHKDFIEGEIAKLLAVEGTKNDGKRYRSLYDEKMARYESENPVTMTATLEVPKDEVIEAPIVEAPKKKKSSKSSPK